MTERWNAGCPVVVVMVWCLTPLSTIFQLHCGDQFYWWKKTGIPGENHPPATSHWQILSHNVVSCKPHLDGNLIYKVNGDRHWL